MEEFISGRGQSNSVELLFKKNAERKNKFEVEAEEIYYKKKKIQKSFQGESKAIIGKK